MYRQFSVRKQDRDYQRIIWYNASGDIQDYTLNTVTFGVTSAPFLAIKTLHQLANDEGHNFPLAARAVKNDFYVDDLLSGSSTIPEGITLRHQLTGLLARGQLNIRQWASNHNALLEGLSSDQINTNLSLNDTDTLKTLGVYWNSKKDVFTYTINSTINRTPITKRVILSETAKIFDPLGLLAPVIVVAKIMIQRLWSLDLSWDASLPSSIHTEWVKYQEKVKMLNNLEFNRNILPAEAQRFQLHGFCDASQKAYGACLYTRSIDQRGKITIELICAKSRVAPLKLLTIPRLELCGAKLLTSLYNTVETIMSIKFEEIYLWTDSTIVLHWLHTSPQKLKTFVSNRVMYIQNNTKIAYWRHVNSQDNPADLISRGINADQLIYTKKWKEGPEWLLMESRWPPPFVHKSIDVPEIKPEQCFLVTDNNSFNILSKYLSITKLQRIIAYCLRMKLNRSTTPYINLHELQNSMKIIIQLLQKTHFQQERQDIINKRALKLTSKLRNLNPMLDRNQILRVGGRLQNSKLNFSAQHPIILPKNNHITELIIIREHQIHGHTGVQATLYLLRRKYWIIDGRSQVWKMIKSCVTCCKVNPPKVEYLMGNLPTPRVNESRPFTHVGIDYCGPFILKQRKFKNRISMKVYVAVFVCLAIKAIHLEVVSNLTTEAFIAALRRFISRRGNCAHIYSDNGTTFVGAQNELRKIIAQLLLKNNHTQIAEFLIPYGIEWHFIPPMSPHFGGLWESAVRAFKYHFKRIAGLDLLFTYEEFNTLAIEIEAILNSRPLTPISSDPNDLLVLTPNHFLIGEKLLDIPEIDLQGTPSNRLSAWQHLQKLKQDFWSRWRIEYLNELTTRNKWHKNVQTIQLGTIVLLRDEHTPPRSWPMGRVVMVHPGEDGIIRTVTVKTAHSLFKRAIRKLAALPIDTTTH